MGNAAGAATKACARRARPSAAAGPLFNQCLPAHPAHRYCEKDWNWYTNSSTMSHSHRLGSIMFRLLFRMTAGGVGAEEQGCEAGVSAESNSVASWQLKRQTPPTSPW